MRVRLRLQRFGRKKSPFYRIVAAPYAFKRDGRFLEIVGLYHPTVKNPADQVRFDETKILFWLNQGASPSETVKQILSSAGLWKKYADEVLEKKRKRIKRKNQKKKEKLKA